jgi:hypothetical protein
MSAASKACQQLVEGRSEIKLMAALKNASACEYIIILYYISYYIW